MVMECEEDFSENVEGWREIPADLSQHHGPAELSMDQARLRALVLEARYLPGRVEPAGDGARLLVPADNYAGAMKELRLFEEENRNWPPLPPSAYPMAENTLSTLSILILLAIFYNLVRLDPGFLGVPYANWVAAGSADAGKILSGEWWRLATALTLHADLLHLSGNLVLGGFIIILLCRELGSGLSWSLLLGSGILGNFANALIQNPEHSSVGASTMVFGAVGILAAINQLRYRGNTMRRRLLPFAAALALLAIFGTEGKQTDLGAHLFGFLSGMALGLIGEFIVARFGRPGRIANALLMALAGAVIAGAWLLAMANVPAALPRL